MNCNCNNKNEIVPDVRIVQGNVMRLAIPLTLRTLEKVGDEIQATDTDFIPSSPVTVEFSKGAVKKTLDVEMRGNIAVITDNGTLPIGVYDVTILCNDENGNPYRFKKTPIVQIVDTTKEAGITAPAEYEVGTWYLNPAIYLAMRGEDGNDGVGIEDITTESSEDIGGMNTITITLTNGQTRTFTVMNGSGSVDDILNINSPHPIANKTVTAKFDELSQGMAQLVGYADYNRDNETIRLFDKQRQTVLASVSGFPFVRNVYISNNTLVVTFSEGSGRSAIGIPLSGVFNPNNYFTRAQVNNLIDGIYDDLNGMIGDKANLTNGKVPYGESSAVVLDAINVSVPTNIPAWMIGKVHYCVDGKIRRYINSGTNYAVAIVSTPDPYLIYFNKDDGKFYTWDSTSGMEEIETGSGGGSGYNVSYSNGVLTFSSDTQPTYNNGVLTL